MLFPARWPKLMPSEDICETGVRVVSLMDRDGDTHSGRVIDHTEKARFIYGRGPRRGWRLGNPLRKRDFILTTPEDDFSIRIRRTRLVPSRFDIYECDDLAGCLKLISAFGNRFSVEIDGIEPWRVALPLFSSRIWADSANSTDAWVLMYGHMAWGILFRSSEADLRLLACLCFIQVDRFHWG